MQKISATIVLKDGIVLPVVWKDLGRQMIEHGVIDDGRFEELFTRREGFGEEERLLLYGDANASMIMTTDNARFLLNLLWAFGLANKNSILDEGAMMDDAYGGPQNFASTAGWTLAAGHAMDHYSRHRFVELTEEQQQRVADVADHIYRPCCSNAVAFPDCNHGMAMLGLLELLAAQDVSKEEMYRLALQVNVYWFPDAYLTMAQFLDREGVAWGDVEPKELLSSTFSSAAGYGAIVRQMNPAQVSGGNSCGV